MLNKITSYTFYLTNQCMLDCPYCYESCFRKEHGIYKMPLEEIYSIINFANDNTPLPSDTTIYVPSNLVERFKATECYKNCEIIAEEN